MFLKFFIILNCFILIKCSISPCAKWNRTGLTIAGTGQSGNSSYQIDSPKGIFLDKKRNDLYVADFNNNRVQKFSLNDPTHFGKTVAFGISNPMKLFVDEDPTGPTIYVSLRFDNRVEKWLNGSTKGIEIGDECRLCSGVSVDKDKNVYMSQSDRHVLTQWSPKTNQTIVIAGKLDVNGTKNQYLDHPQGIYVTNDGNSIFIADMWNNRIQKWTKTSSQGQTVAGSNNGTEGHDNKTLNYPNDVFVDEENQIVYVVDTSNHRIQRWKPFQTEGENIVGDFGQGNATSQLNKPVGLSFDSNGNLYVLDMGNNRVQMFQLIQNDPCSLTSKGNSFQFGSISTMIISSFLFVFFLHSIN